MHSIKIAGALKPASTVEHDTAAAVDFLSHLVVGGRVALAAITPDGPGVSGKTFTLPTERDALATWIEARQGCANLYFSLNEPKAAADQAGRNGKLVEADVVAIRGVAIDVDPDPKIEVEPGGREREGARLDALVAELRGDMLGGATAIIRTGAGVQAIWAFPTPMLATAEATALVKAQARGLEARFGSDAIHNLDRLLRLPGTVNIPDARKRARGRVRSPAEVISLTADRWALRHLTMFAEPAKRAASGEAGALDLTEAMAVLGAPELLPADLASRIAAAQERSPSLHRALDDELAAGQFADRSGRDFAIVMAAAEQGILDPLEVASVVAAFSPDKTADERHGEAYLARTVANGLARAAAGRLHRTDWFEPSAACPAAEAAAVPSGLVTIRGRIDPATLPVRQWLVEPRIPLAG